MRLTGLEPAHRKTLDPKSSASTNFATGASLYKSGAKLQKKNDKMKGMEFFLFFFKKSLCYSEKSCTFASHLKNKCFRSSFSTEDIDGALDERFSLWSAKPAKAVRLRHAPLNIESCLESFKQDSLL